MAPCPVQAPERTTPILIQSRFEPTWNVRSAMFDVPGTYRNFRSTFLVNCISNPTERTSSTSSWAAAIVKLQRMAARNSHARRVLSNTNTPLTDTPTNDKHTHPSLSDFMNFMNATHTSLRLIVDRIRLEEAHKAGVRFEKKSNWTTSSSWF